MARYYLIISDRDSGCVIHAERRNGMAILGYSEVRRALEDRAGYVAAFSPIEGAPMGSEFVIVYTSDNPEGIGRIGGNFQEWAVIK